MKLSKEQIDKIETCVIQGRITIPSLRDDLIDHLCCEVEFASAQETILKNRLTRRYANWLPRASIKLNGKQNFFYNQIKSFMKKVLYFIGLASTISMTMGLMFKIMHMPGADQLINYGFFAFAFVFLPVIFARKLGRASQLSLSEKFKAVIGLISAVGLLISIVFKMRMEINLATIFLFSTTIVFCFGFLPLQFYDLYRKELKQVN